MSKPQVRYLTFADPENFLMGGQQNGSIMAQTPTFGAFRSQSKILINLSPQILGLLRLYFPLSREQLMLEPGTVLVRLGRFL